jgi:anti-anti-sigma factor
LANLKLAKLKLATLNWQTSWTTGKPPVSRAIYQPQKEKKLKLSLETRNLNDVIIVHCQGRIVYRDEAAALSRLGGELLQHTKKLVLDFSGVTAMDSAGIGELALLQTWVREKKVSLKCAGLTSPVQLVLGLTNLDTVLDIYCSVGEALDSFCLDSFCDDEICADC